MDEGRQLNKKYCPNCDGSGEIFVRELMEDGSFPDMTCIICKGTGIEPDVWPVFNKQITKVDEAIAIIEELVMSTEESQARDIKKALAWLSKNGSALPNAIGFEG